MTNFRFPFFLPLFFCLMLSISVSAAEQISPTRGEAAKMQGETDPYEVTLYREANYVNSIGTWKLSPGMRMLKIPNIDGTPVSVLLGSKVRALLFYKTDFSSLWGPNFITPRSPYTKVVNSTPYLNNIGSSLIIHRKDISDFLGVYLISSQGVDSLGQFYPLPEKASESAIIYQKIPLSEPLSLEFMHGGPDTGMAMGPSLTPPSIYDMVVTIAFVNGVTLNLPDSNIKEYPFNFAKYKNGPISSIKIQYKGPITPAAYLDAPLKAQRAPAASDSPSSSQGSTTGQAPTVVRAPAAPNAIPDVSGKWNSSIGVNYNITQQGDHFLWTVTNISERGEGVVKGGDVNASWRGRQGSGSSQGKITATDANGRATKIDWNNGVQFFR